jgi:long-chain acyl-CoA synthetase
MFSNLPFLYKGASVVLRKRFSASNFWHECKDYSVNSSSVSPTILSLLLEHEKQAPSSSEISLKYIKVASAPTPKELAERFENRFGKNLLLETFGLTETTAINTMNPLNGKRKFGSIGQALSPQKVRIVDEHNNTLGANEVGELLIQSELIMKEYYLDPANTSATIKNGWLHSGDLATIDKEGFVFIVGRKKEMIIRGGENISPLEVEQVAAMHPDIIEAAAVGLSDPIWGECVGLVVVSSGEPNPNSIIEFCRERLSPFKVPEYIAFSDKLPRNAMGKITRNDLRAAFSTAKG